MFHCFDKANCHTGTAETYNCKSLSSSRSYNNNNYQKIVVKKYIVVCERLANKENLERFGFCFCIGFFFGSVLKTNKRTKNPTEIIIQKTLWTSYTTAINNGYNLNPFIPRKNSVLNIRQPMIAIPLTIHLTGILLKNTGTFLLKLQTILLKMIIRDLSK